MLKKTLTKILSLALIALMVLPLAVACVKQPNDPEKGSDTQKSTTAETTPGENTNESNPNESQSGTTQVEPSLPELDFKGAVVKILAWSDVEHPEFEISDDLYDPSSVIDKALHDRIIKTEEKLHIDIQFGYKDGDSGERNNWVKHIQADVENIQEYSIYAGYSLSMAACANKGYCYDLNGEDSRKYLDFSKPWWPDKLISEGTVKNHLYFASGDISNNALYMMYTCFVNKDLLEEYGLQNPQELVESGKWTYDKFFEYAKNVYKDQNGNGEKDAASEGSAGDVFGYMTSGIHVDPWFYGTGAVIVEKDANGNLIPSSSFGGEKVVKTVEKLCNFLYNENGGIYTTSVWHQKNFRDGNLLFCIDRARISFKDNLLSANDNLKYSVLPCPKYDETGSYVTVMGNPFTLYAMPTYAGVKKTVDVGAATLETLASISYKTLSHAVFEITYKLKYAQDPTSAKMFDLIKESLTFDIGRIFSDALINQGDFRNVIGSNAANGWTTKSKVSLKTLKNLLPTLQKNLCGE